MKRRIILCLIITLTLLLTSCGNLRNNFIEMPNGVDITVSEDFMPYMANKDTLPVIHFDYNGVRISDMSTAARVIFVQNDQFELSEKFKNHLSQYTSDQIVITRSVEREEDKRRALRGRRRNGGLLCRDRGGTGGRQDRFDAGASRFGRKRLFGDADVDLRRTRAQRPRDGHLGGGHAGEPLPQPHQEPLYL